VARGQGPGARGQGTKYKGGKEGPRAARSRGHGPRTKVECRMSQHDDHRLQALRPA